ncbi:hypothetical protein [Paraclostridium sordellii]|uniref:hypothetical protein n=1 Tax=Paraclostridium sordellii TaxID=1505 RepID=UPI0011C109B2|nr:hypothetical protein [Paeniclostridium sordellii]
MKRLSTKYNFNFTESSNLNYQFKLDRIDNLVVSLNQLNNTMSLKAKDFINFANNNNDLKGRALWLNSWEEVTKKHIMSKINSIVVSNTLKDEDLNTLENRIKKYETYFKFLEQEDDEVIRYENLFNYLTQIPSQINTFLKSCIQFETFKTQRTVYSGSSELASSYEDANFYYLAA